MAVYCRPCHCCPVVLRLTQDETSCLYNLTNAAPASREQLERAPTSEPLRLVLQSQLPRLSRPTCEPRVVPNTRLQSHIPTTAASTRRPLARATSSCRGRLGFPPRRTWSAS